MKSMWGLEWLRRKSQPFSIALYGLSSSRSAEQRPPGLSISSGNWRPCLSISSSKWTHVDWPVAVAKCPRALPHTCCVSCMLGKLSLVPAPKQGQIFFLPVLSPATWLVARAAQAAPSAGSRHCLGKGGVRATSSKKRGTSPATPLPILSTASGQWPEAAAALAGS